MFRYGENPHQAAAFYTDLSLAEHHKGGIATAVQHHGKEMSYNNYLDADAAYSCCCDFKVGFANGHDTPRTAVSADGTSRCRLAAQAFAYAGLLRSELYSITVLCELDLE